MELCNTLQVIDQPFLAAANTAAVAASSTVASPMPVRQIQFPSYRPALPQQSRVVGLHTKASTTAVDTDHAVRDLPGLGRTQLPLQKPTRQQQQQQQQSHSRPHQGTAVAPLQPSELAARGNAAACLPSGTAAAAGATTRQQGVQSVQLPYGTAQAQAQVLVPSSILFEAMLAASLAAGPPLAQQPSQQHLQLPQQLPQQLPHSVGPRLQITWPQPVVCWPQHEHASSNCARPTMRQHQGLDPHLPAPDASDATPAGSEPLRGGGHGPPQQQVAPPQQHVTSAKLAGSAPLQGGTHAPPQQLIARATPAEAAPPQGVGHAFVRPVGVSGPPVGSAPLRGVATAPTEGSVPSIDAASASAQLAAGVQLELGARVQGNVMPPNKR